MPPEIHFYHYALIRMDCYHNQAQHRKKTAAPFEHSSTLGSYPVKPQGIRKKRLYSYFIFFSKFLCNRQIVSERLLYLSQVKHGDAYPYPKHPKKKGVPPLIPLFPIAMKINGPYQEKQWAEGSPFFKVLHVFFWLLFFLFVL